MSKLWQDLHYTARIFVKNPVFLLFSILTLALGIGGNATVFSWIEGILLHPLPGVSDQTHVLAVAGIRQPQDRCCTFSYPDYVEYRDHTPALEGFFGAELASMNLSIGGEPERVAGQVVTGNFFSLLGVKPFLGRGFLPEEDQTPMTHPVAVISYGLWKRRFGSDIGLIGKTQSLNGRPFTIIGVAPKDFKGTFVGYAIDVWVPVMMAPVFFPQPDRLTNHDDFWLEGYARIRPDATVQQAQEQVNAISTQLQARYPTTHRGFLLKLYPLSKLPFGATRFLSPVFALSLAILAMVLLIACANLAGLLLARAIARRQEIAVRMAIGASRARIIRQMLTESVVLAILGGAGGCLVAYALKDSLGAFFPPREIGISLTGQLDIRVLVITMAVAAFTGLLFGLTPAIQSSRDDLISGLNQRTGNTGNRGRARLRSALVVVQISLSVVLLITAALFLQSLRNEKNADLGFNTRTMLVSFVDLFSSGYNEAQGKVFYRQLLARTERIPGIESATLAWRVPMNFRNPPMVDITVEGYTPPDATNQPYAEYNLVGPNYLHVLGIGPVQGRDFTSQDNEQTSPVSIVNETMARKYWPGESPIGKRVRILNQWTEIVGVARDVKYHTLHESPRPYIYVPILQSYSSQGSVLARTVGNPNNLVLPFQTAAKELNPQLAFFDVQSMSSFMAYSTFGQRVTAMLLGIFGILALLLAATGLYGVIALGVAQRVHEIGIRMALGAQRFTIMLLIVRGALILTLCGVILGVIASFAAARLIANQIYGISASDPLTFLGISVMLGVVAVLASVTPATRAIRIDPLQALRYE